MKNAAAWTPSKFEWHRNRLRGSRDAKAVSPGSILLVDLIARWYEDVLHHNVSGSLLDLGCGRAPLYMLYKDLSDSITCVDWVNSPHEIAHIDVAADLNEPLALPSASFDVVLLSDVLEHIARPWMLWSEIARVLKPGGRLIGNVPFLYWIHEAPHDYHRYTAFALQRYALDNGFEPRVEVIGGLLEVLGDLFSKLLNQVPVVGPGAARALSAMCFAAGRTAAGQKVMKKSGVFFPLAYGFIMTRLPDKVMTGPLPE